MQRLSVLILLFCFSLTSVAQRHRKIDSANVKHPYGIYLAIGPSFSGLDIYKNYFQNPHRTGFNSRLYYEFSNTMRITGEFTRISKFNYAPSWQKLSAFNIDLNLQFMARIKDEYSIFYFFMGVCRHEWNGLFLKQSAFYDAIAFYKPNSIIKHSWFGMNIGAGLERAFKHFEIFAEYRYRFTQSDNVFSVADVAVNVGIKKKIPFKKIFRKLNDRYTWF